MTKNLRFYSLLGLCMLLFSSAYAQEPTILGLLPVAGAAEVETNSNLQITFDSDMQKGTGNILVRQYTDDVIIETIDVSSSQVSISNASVTIDLLDTLSVSTAYYIQIELGAFESLSGTAFSGINDKTSWNFTTVTVPNAPGNLTLAIVSGTEVNLSWEDNSQNEIGFSVLRSTASDFSRDSVVTFLSENTIGFNDNPLSAEETYYYQVSAVNSEFSVPSNIVANVACPPDLQFDLTNTQTVISSDYSTIAIGEQVKLFGRIVNNANCTPNFAAQPTFKVFLSEDKLLDAGDINLTAENGVPLKDLKEDEGVFVQNYLSSVSIPGDTSLVGNHYLIISLDPNQKVYERDETNNTFSIPVTISRQVDVKIENLLLDLVDDANGQLNVSFDLINLSDAAVGSFTIGYSSPEVSSGRLHRTTFNGLLKGDTIRVNEVVPLSCENFGTFDLVATVNDRGVNNKISLKESNTTNNTDTAQYTFSGGGKPDLLITYLGFNIKDVNTIDAGASLTLTTSIQNKGADLATASDVTYFLSVDNILDANDIELGTSVISSGMTCNEVVRLSKTVEIPSGTPLGNYAVLAVIDYPASLDELNEENNSAYDLLVVSNTPDLIAGNVVVNNEPNSMGEISLSYNITNQGNGPVNYSYADIFLSADNVFDSGDLLISQGHNTGVPRLAAGETYSGALIIDLTSCAAAGDQYVFVKADGSSNTSLSTGLIPETNENNNVNTEGVVVNITKVPDLYISHISGEQKTDTTTLTARVYVTNRSGAASSTSTLKFYLSNDETLGSTDTELKSVSIPALSCSQTQTYIGEKLTLPSGMEDGKYTIIVVADQGNVVTEVNEDGNTDFFIFNKGTSPLDPDPDSGDTTPSCVLTDPSGLIATNITENSATLNWVQESGLTYQVWVEGQNVVNVNGSSLNVTNLPQGATVAWSVRSLCGSAASEWVHEELTTAGAFACGPPSGFSVSNIAETSATLNWEATTGVYYQIWVETLGTQAETTSSGSYALSNLPSGTTLSWAVRTNCDGTFTDWSIGPDFTTTGVASCPLPSGLVASNVTTSSATLGWEPVEGISSYQVWVDGQTVTTLNTNTYEASNLASGTEVKWAVRTLCPGGVNSDWFTATFTTDGVAVCSPPTGLTAANVTSSSATLNWEAVTDVEAYQLWVEGIGVISEYVYATSYNVSSLTAGKTISWAVRALCPGGKPTDWSASQLTTSSAAARMVSSTQFIVFELNYPSAAETEQANALLEELVQNQDALTVYPNPAKDRLNFTITGNNTITSISVLNLQGATAKSEEIINSNNATIEVGELSSGFYLVRIEVSNQRVIIRKVLIE